MLIALYTQTGPVDNKPQVGPEVLLNGSGMINGMPYDKYVDVVNHANPEGINRPEAVIFPYITVHQAKNLLRIYNDKIDNGEPGGHFWEACAGELTQSLANTDVETQFISIQRGQLILSPKNNSIFSIGTSFPIPAEDGRFHVIQTVIGTGNYNAKLAQEMHDIANEWIAICKDLPGVVFDGVSFYNEYCRPPQANDLVEFGKMLRAMGQNTDGGKMYVAEGNVLQNFAINLFRFLPMLKNLPLVQLKTPLLSEAVDYILNKQSY